MPLLKRTTSRIWVMDRGIPTEDSLAKMRTMGASYLVGTPKGRLTKLEQAFKEIKHDLAIRPIFHKTEERIEAHIFVAFLAECLQVTLKARLRAWAGGTTPREVLAKVKDLQRVDVHLPTTDGCELTLSRYTQPEAEHRMLLEQLRLSLPSQPPPKITAVPVRQAGAELTMQWRPAGRPQIKSTTEQ